MGRRFFCLHQTAFEGEVFFRIRAIPIGCGHSLLRAGEMKAERVELMSNSVLKPAIALYRFRGFEVVPEGKDPVCSRSNVMPLDLPSRGIPQRGKE